MSDTTPFRYSFEVLESYILVCASVFLLWEYTLYVHVHSSCALDELSWVVWSFSVVLVGCWNASSYLVTRQSLFYPFIIRSTPLLL